jgi:predicted O-methyltransferase YrrM
MHNGHPRFADTLIPLDPGSYDYRVTSISAEEGDFLWRLVRDNGYQKTIEIGCALGISSLYICDAAASGSGAAHVAVDPFQSTQWQNLGVRNVQARGTKNFTLIEEVSELALPRLLGQKETFDFAFIDGWHTFDHTLVDFFYLNRMVRVGGMIAFDDANWPAVTKVLRYLSHYPAYEVILPGGSGAKATKRGFQRALLGAFYAGSRLIPRKLRNELFTEHVLSGQARYAAFPSVVALKKVAEDERNWDWYAPF